MYINSTILTSLYQRVGWRQPTYSGAPVLDSANKVTNSGKYFQDIHSLVKVPYIYDCQDDNAITIGNFNTMLQDFQKSSILKIVNSVFQMPDIVQNDILYSHENIFTNVLTNGADFVGYEFDMCKRKDFGLVINQLISEFSVSESVTFYLYHSSQKTAIDSETITVQANSTKVDTVDWIMNYATYKGGKYYVGYFRSGLTTQAINRNWDSAIVSNEFDGVEIKPIKISGVSGVELPNIDGITYESDTYGLNFDITIEHDYTDVICRNARQFDVAVQLQLASDVIELIATSRRTTLDEHIGKAAVAELNATPEQFHGGGIKARLEKEIKRLNDIFFKKVKIKTLTLS